jgi:hypothetical protein
MDEPLREEKVLDAKAPDMGYTPMVVADLDFLLLTLQGHQIRICG